MNENKTCASCYKVDDCEIADVMGEDYPGCDGYVDNEGVIISPFKIGSVVYTLDYENDKPIDYSEWILLMCNSDFVLLSPILNTETDPTEICNRRYDSFLDNDIDKYHCGVIAPVADIFTESEVVKELEKHRCSGGV